VQGAIFRGAANRIQEVGGSKPKNSGFHRCSRAGVPPARPMEYVQLWRGFPATEKIPRPSPGNRLQLASSRSYSRPSNEAFGFKRDY
jgi:hypothetical protein